jgi:hypothetical protein
MANVANKEGLINLQLSNEKYMYFVIIFIILYEDIKKEDDSFQDIVVKDKF